MKALLTAILLAQALGNNPPPGSPPAPQVDQPAVQAPSGSQPAQVQPSPTRDVPQQGVPEQPGGQWTMLVFFGVMILIFWLLIIRPQQKQKKKQEQFLESLKTNDRVITSAGIIGRISKIEGAEVELELAKDVKIRILKSSIAARHGDGEAKQ